MEHRAIEPYMELTWEACLADNTSTVPGLRVVCDARPTALWCRVS
jgi:hypothetical protein